MFKKNKGIFNKGFLILIPILTFFSFTLSTFSPVFYDNNSSIEKTETFSVVDVEGAWSPDGRNNGDGQHEIIVYYENDFPIGGINYSIYEEGSHDFVTEGEVSNPEENNEVNPDSGYGYGYDTFSIFLNRNILNFETNYDLVLEYWDPFSKKQVHQGMSFTTVSEPTKFYGNVDNQIAEFHSYSFTYEWNSASEDEFQNTQTTFILSESNSSNIKEEIITVDTIGENGFEEVKFYGLEPNTDYEIKIYQNDTKFGLPVFEENFVFETPPLEKTFSSTMEINEIDGYASGEYYWELNDEDSIMAEKVSLDLYHADNNWPLANPIESQGSLVPDDTPTGSIDYSFNAKLDDGTEYLIRETITYDDGTDQIIDHYFEHEWDDIVENHNDLLPKEGTFDNLLVAARVLGRKSRKFLKKSKSLQSRIYKVLNENLFSIESSIIAKEWARLRDCEVEYAHNVCCVVLLSKGKICRYSRRGKNWDDRLEICETSFGCACNHYNFYLYRTWS